MSCYIRKTKNPKTGEEEEAYWIDDFFGPHRYGVVFPSDVGITLTKDFVENWKKLDFKKAKKVAYKAEDL